MNYYEQLSSEKWSFKDAKEASKKIQDFIDLEKKEERGAIHIIDDYDTESFFDQNWDKLKKCHSILDFDLDGEKSVKLNKNNIYVRCIDNSESLDFSGKVLDVKVLKANSKSLINFICVLYYLKFKKCKDFLNRIAKHDHIFILVKSL